MLLPNGINCDYYKQLNLVGALVCCHALVDSLLHSKMKLIAILLSSEIILSYCYGEYYVNISHNGPVVLGATISFKAELFSSSGDSISEKLTFNWRDNAIPSHTGQTEGYEAVSYWNVSYPASDGYVPGRYEVEVSVEKWVFVYWVITSKRVEFEVTATLNGGLNVMQSGKTVAGPFISNAEGVKHEVVLSSPDFEYISRAPQVYSFWYVDCVYYGFSEGYDFTFNYPLEEKTHNVEAFMMVSFEPLPTPEPSTTTTVPPTTTGAPNSTTSTTPTTSTSTTSAPTTTGKSVNDNEDLMAKKIQSTYLLADVPYICMNSSIIPPDPKKTYGYFSRQLKCLYFIAAPVANVSINGTNWLKHGDMLNLQITCKGSYPYSHCVHIVTGSYNVTGNETCRPGEGSTAPFCEFYYMHYFPLATTYTVLIIIANDVSVKVTQVAVNIYEVTKKAQLSVIVVPVVCSIMAVVLIVFGVAYYVQNRRRFVVEVADFHFGHEDVGMEYKTFNERLKEAILNAFNRSIVDDDFSDSDSERDQRTSNRRWPQRGLRYTAGPSSNGTAGGPNGIGGRGDANGQRYGSME
ncbi:hypothetical protein J437_LFUL001975 [Ladona fulva]|uniref:Uncharacterized protein n=1 Tax=Ladona fulva TaxID=123851 RepID=A0A8K0JW72_LADFU|nr:hypothetical protein J437_LFUL001975 [Ladona fulva]